MVIASIVNNLLVKIETRFSLPDMHGEPQLKST